jgi:hypothetical protein
VVLAELGWFQEEEEMKRTLQRLLLLASLSALSLTPAQASGTACFLVKDSEVLSENPLELSTIFQTIGCYASYDQCNSARGGYMTDNPTLYVDLCYSSGYVFFYNHDTSNAFYSDPVECASAEETTARTAPAGSVGPCIRIF